MKSRSFLKDRLLIFVLILLVPTCATAIGALLVNLRDARRVNSALLAQIDTLNHRLAAPTPSPARPVPTNKATLRVKAVQGSQHGRPIAAMTLALQGAAFTDKPEELTAQTDADGAAAFGPIRPGRYTLAIKDSGQQYAYKLAQPVELTLYGGQTSEQILQCPLDLDARLRETALSVDWDDGLSHALGLDKLGKDEFFLVGGALILEPQIIAGRTWLGSPVRFLTTLEGEYTTEYEYGLTSNRKIPVLKLTAPDSFKKVQFMPAGRYLLARLFIRKGHVGPDYLPVNFSMEFTGQDPVTLDLSIFNKDPLRIPLPDKFKDDLAAAYGRREATLDLRDGANTTFRDLILTPSMIQFAGRDNPFNLEYALLTENQLDLQFNTLQPEKPCKIGDYEVTLQRPPDNNSDARRLRVRYLP